MKNAQRRWLLIMNVIFNLVMGFILPVNTIFITKYLHESMVTAGFVLMIYSLMMMIGNVLGGYLFDHFSHQATLNSGYLIAALAFLLLARWHSWPIYAVLLILAGLGMGIASTAVNSYTALVAQQSLQSQQIFNIMYLAANVGIAVGSMLVSVIFQYSIFLTFFLPAVCFLLCLWIVFAKGTALDGCFQNQNDIQSNFQVNLSKSATLKSTALQINLVLICVAIFIVWLGYCQWDSNLSIYMLNQHLSMHQYSLLFSVNAASLIIIQPLMNRLTEHFLKSIKWQIVLGIFIMGSSFLWLPDARLYGRYVVSMLILTIGESITFPTIPSLLNQFSNENNRGRYQSFYVVFSSLGRAIGPYVGSLIVAEFSFNILFYLTVGGFLLVAVGVMFVREVRSI
ncbi:MFS transporter [Bombilactobacillus folatiphilus]|uniref:MFS transporter n=1 Tax=Bombilactobacillus folatiphilus TaxID=2923362 RepID=A0ABY4P940_9LACO|nr:MFS transporter [Bombilactobacillus folatiphilus]UQS82036.1 MFS transporter [Bombilactobacillus folatiphilus]